MNRKRVLLIGILALIVILLSYVVVAYAIPVSKFRKRTQAFNQYVVERSKESSTEAEYKLELTVDEYKDFQNKLLQDGWHMTILNNGLELIEYKNYYAVPLNISDNNYYEVLKVVRNQEKVEIFYEARLNISIVPFVRIK